MSKIVYIFWSELVLLILLVVLGFLQFTKIDSFWKVNFESLANIFITASLGIIGLYISVNIIESNTSKRRKLDFMESQLNKLSDILDSDVIKLVVNNHGEYPPREDFLSSTQKIRDIISNVGEFMNILKNSQDQYENLVDNFEQFNTVSDYYCNDAIHINEKKINQRREDMIQNIKKIVIEVYKMY